MRSASQLLEDQEAKTKRFEMADTPPSDASTLWPVTRYRETSSWRGERREVARYPASPAVGKELTVNLTARVRSE